MCTGSPAPEDDQPGSLGWKLASVTSRKSDSPRQASIAASRGSLSSQLGPTAASVAWDLLLSMPNGAI